MASTTPAATPPTITIKDASQVAGWSILSCRTAAPRKAAPIASDQEIEKHLATLDKHLAGKTYLVADQFSLADVCYMPFLDFLPLMEITPPTAVAAWSQRLLARPSAAATRPEK